MQLIPWERILAVQEEGIVGEHAYARSPEVQRWLKDFHGLFLVSDSVLSSASESKVLWSLQQCFEALTMLSGRSWSVGVFDLRIGKESGQDFIGSPIASYLPDPRALSLPHRTISLGRAASWQ